MSNMTDANDSSSRLYTVTSTDHTAYIVIGTAVGMAMLPVFGMIRYFVRRATEFGADDVLLMCSTAIAIAQSGVLLRACSYGLGQSTTELLDSRIAIAEKLYYSSTILWVLSVAASKASTASLLLRLGVTKQHRIAFRAMLGYVAVWTVAAVFTLALQCNLSRPWTLVGSECPNSALRWQVISVFDLLFEIAIPVAAAVFVWPLKASTGTKLNVVFAFAFRVLLVIIVAIRLINFPNGFPTTDPLLRLDLFVVWSQTQMFWSIISAIIPSLRPFLRGLSTYTEGLGGSSTDPHSQAAYQLSNLRSTGKGEHHQRKSQTGWKSGNVLDSISNGVRYPGHNSTVVRAQKKGDANDARSLNSEDSQNMIIQKDVQISIDWDASQGSK